MDQFADRSEFTVGPIALRDLRTCLEIRPYQMARERYGTTRALQLWEKIICSGEACGHVAMSRAVGPKREIVAVGIGVFVTNEFASYEIQHPQPGLNARILESVANGKSVIADYHSLARANAAATLQQVIMYCSIRDGLLSPTEETLARNLLARSYGELFLGYRIERMISEVHGDADMKSLANYPSIEVASGYQDYFRKHQQDAKDKSVLCVAIGENFKKDPSSIAAPIYLGQSTPRFMFSRGQYCPVNWSANVEKTNDDK